MKTNTFLLIILALSFFTTIVNAQDKLKITTVGHASVMFEFDTMVIQVDPVMSEGDYTKLPDAQLVLITHSHGDHLDLKAINAVKKDNTILIYTQACANQISYTDSAIVMANGDSVNIYNIPVLAVPAYNFTKTNHPKGVGNGYIFTFGGQRIYIAGDTENIPEMEHFGKIDIAFIPMNQPYTMTAKTAADAALKINPKILYIYHYDQTFVKQLLELLRDQKDMEIRADDKIIKAIGEPLDTSNTSIPDFDALDHIFFPNPATDRIYVSGFSDVNFITFYNLFGNLILTAKPKENKSIDISSLAKGMYLIKYERNNKIFVSKFLVK